MNGLKIGDAVKFPYRGTYFSGFITKTLAYGYEVFCKNDMKHRLVKKHEITVSRKKS